RDFGRTVQARLQCAQGNRSLYPGRRVHSGLSTAAGSVAARVHGIAAQNRRPEIERRGEGGVPETGAAERVSGAGVWRTRFTTAGESGRVSTSETRAFLMDAETVKALAAIIAAAAALWGIYVFFSNSRLQRAKWLFELY